MMSEKMDVIIANPAGNTTIFVLTPVPLDRYQEVTGKLLDIDFKTGFGGAFAEGTFTEDIYANEIKGEQLGFVLPDTPQGLPAMNMSGLEFCGNASRAFAFYKAVTMDPVPETIRISVSGCDEPLTATIDVPGKDSKIQMPLPKLAATYSAQQLGIVDRYPDMADGILVDMDGIFHLVLKDVDASPEIFEEIKAKFYPDSDTGDALTNFPAFGVMFYNTKSEILTPVVYVHEVATTYFEGSCASGTTATSFAASLSMPDGVHKMAFQQPAGTLFTEVTKESGQVTGVELNGLIELSDVITVEI